MRVAVVGLWHTGTVTAACLASLGHSVTAVDGDRGILERLRSGNVPVFEPGLQDLIHAGVTGGRLRFDDDLNAIGDCDVVWLTYDTPVDEMDRADVALVLRLASEVLPFVADGAPVLISSQLPLGSTAELEKAYARLRPGGTSGFGYLPENLRLGKAIDAFMTPARVVAGLRRPQDVPVVQRLLAPLSVPVEWMSVESAEMTKHALNSFLATSVAFINEIASLCERTGANAHEVERGLKTDPRIGQKAYLRAGGAFAGGTLARDLNYLVEMGKREQSPVPLCAAVIESNEQHKQWTYRQLLDLGRSLDQQHVAVLGLTYKVGTDTLRRSLSVEVCRWLHDRKARVTAFDPVVKELPDDLRAVIGLCGSVEEAVTNASALLIGMEWPEFASISPSDLVRWMSEPVVIDQGRFLEASLGGDSRIRYLTVGRPR